MPLNVTVNEKGAKTVLLRGMGNEKARITVMLGVLAEGRKLPPYATLWQKTMPKEKLLVGLVFWCQEKGWMTNELLMDWVKVIWK
jgi:hypothetical protein